MSSPLVLPLISSFSTNPLYVVCNNNSCRSSKNTCLKYGSSSKNNNRRNGVAWLMMLIGVVVVMMLLSCENSLVEATSTLSLSWDNETLIVQDGANSIILDSPVQVISALFSQDKQRVISIQESIVSLYKYSTSTLEWYKEMDVTAANVTTASMLANQLVLGYEYRVEIYSCLENDSCVLDITFDSEEQSFGGLLSFTTDGNYLMVGAPNMEDNGVVFIYKKSISSSAWTLINRLVNPSSSVSASQFMTNVLLPQIRTIVGSGNIGYSGDGGAATSASLHVPTSIAVDSSGNIYIADAQNHRVRKYTASTGKISTIAGTGDQGYNGDNIAATTARLNAPTGVALDSSSNVYIADSQNHRIRKITISTGKISTIAGDGTAGYAGDGLVATASSLNNPTSVSVDQSSSNTVYIADTNNLKIRKITSSRLYVIAGTDYTYSPYIQSNLIYEGLAQYIKITAPTSVVASGGKIFFVEGLINTVRQVVVLNGYYTMTTVAGGCRPGFPSTTEFACLDSPFGLALASNGDLYVADKSNARVKKINLTTKTISTVAGGSSTGFAGDNGPAILSSLNGPCGVAVQSNGALYIADTNNQRIRKVL